MKKNLVFLFVFIFSPAVIINAGVNGNTKRDKSMEKGMILESTPKTLESESVCDSLTIGLRTMSTWHTASGSYYDPKNSSQTKERCDGIGAFGREIQSGSIALGSAFTKFFVQKSEDIIVFIEIKNLNIITPFGKGIFRLDDAMNKKFSKSEKFYSLDFNRQDLKRSDWLESGRFYLVFRIFKVIKTADI